MNKCKGIVVIEGERKKGREKKERRERECGCGKVGSERKQGREFSKALSE